VRSRNYALATKAYRQIASSAQNRPLGAHGQRRECGEMRGHETWPGAAVEKTVVDSGYWTFEQRSLTVAEVGEYKYSTRLVDSQLTSFQSHTTTLSSLLAAEDSSTGNVTSLLLASRQHIRTGAHLRWSRFLEAVAETSETRCCPSPFGRARFCASNPNY
jgi:hypothetical protein